MSNPRATNAVVTTPVGRKRYLESTKDGAPINRQVPRTYQVYAGTGNATIDYDGSNELVVFGSTLTGPLTVNLGPLSRIRNMVGRSVTLNIVSPISQTITLNSSPAFMMLNGTSLQQLSHVIVADNLSKSIVLYFHSESNINLDYGASSSSIIPSLTFANVGVGEGVYANTVGRLVNLRRIDDLDRTIRVATIGNTIGISSRTVIGGGGAERYPYGNSISDSAGGAFQVHNPSADTIDVTTQYNTGYTPAGLFTITTPTISGIAPIYDYVWTPGPRMNRPVSVSVNFYRGPTDLIGSTRLDMVPAMENVLETENVMCCHPGSVFLSMYDPDKDPGTELFAKMPYGFSLNDIETDIEPLCISTDLQDNLIFYVPSSNRTLINVASSSINQFYGEFTDITVLDNSLISGAGYGIRDLCYSEVTSTLYALPTKHTNSVIVVPVLPKLYDAVNFPIVTIGTPTFVPFDGISPPLGNLYSICLLNDTGDFLIAYEDGTTKIGAFRIHDNKMKLLYAYDTGNNGPVSLMMGSRGRIIAQYEQDNGFYVSTPGLSLLDGLTLTYSAPRFYTSLTVNCYNYIAVP